MKITTCSKISLAIFLSYLNLNAQDFGENLRESCRQEIAGMYLVVYDRTQLAKKRLEVYRNENEQTQANVKILEKQLKNLNEALDKSVFDFSSMELKTQLETQVEHSKDQLVERAKLLVIYEKELLDSKKEFLEIEKPISAVFDIKKNKDAGGYQLQIDYKESCPEFNISCPLPKESASRLRVLFPNDNKLPISCKKYSNLIF